MREITKFCDIYEEIYEYMIRELVRPLSQIIYISGYLYNYIHIPHIHTNVYIYIYT